MLVFSVHVAYRLCDVIDIYCRDRDRRRDRDRDRGRDRDRDHKGKERAHSKSP